MFRIFIFFLALPAIVNACQVPVFRYALERWEADRIKIVANGEDFNFFKNRKSGNFSITESDQADQINAYLTNIPLPFFSGELKDKKSLLESPVRSQIFKDLTGGVSAVWVLLKSGNESLDAEAEKNLSESLEKATEFYAKKRHKDFKDESFQEEIKTNIPLKVKFTYLSLSKNNLEEAIFISMLLNIEPDLKDISQPMAFAIYGRGRCLPPLIGKGISHKNVVDEDCAYLCGDCTCEVKDQNPGTDLLFSQDWDKALEGRLLVKEKELPPLTGVLFQSPLQEVETISVPKENELSTESPSEQPKPIYALIFLSLAGIFIWRLK
jgi:hypothetical protein